MRIRHLLFRTRSASYLSTCNVSKTAVDRVRKNMGEIEEILDHEKTLANANENKTLETVMKMRQRYPFDPRKWPEEEKPFAMIDKNFMGKIMHVKELTPERGFANIVPFGMMVLRHIFRKAQTDATLKNFKNSPVLNVNNIQLGTKAAFELIAKNAYNNTMDDLVERGICKESVVKRFTAAGSQMSPRQRDLLNLTQDDIYAIAPGPSGPFQKMWLQKVDNDPYITYSLLCCAFYKKKVLFDAVRDLPLLDKSEEKDQLSMPSDYGYASYRTIFGFLTFGNKLLDFQNDKLDPEVKLLDFQVIVM